VEEKPAPAPAPVVEEKPAPAPAPVVEEKPAPVVEEKPAPAEATAAPVPVMEEKPAAPEVTATPAPVIEEEPAPVEEIPAEEPAPAEQTEEAIVEEIAEEMPAEPVEEVPAPAEEPAAEEPAQQPAEEIPAETAEAFSGKLSLDVVTEGPIYEGDEIVLKANVQDGNMDYSISWENLDTADSHAEWKPVAHGEKFSFPANDAAARFNYRAHLIAEDETSLYTREYTFSLSAKEVPAEEMTAEEETMAAPAEEILADEEPAESAPEADMTEETPAAPAEEIPAEEEPMEEMPAEETPVNREVIEEAAAEESVKEQPAETVKKESASLKRDAAPQSRSAETEDEMEEMEDIDEYATPLGRDDYQTITLEGENEVNVREGADGLAAIYSMLPEGAELTVINVVDDWVTVVADGELGYIYIDDIAEYLTIEEEETEEPAEVAEEEAEEIAKKVTIFTSRRRVMDLNEPVYLTSKIEGFEDCNEIMYVWYVDRGNGFEKIEGANDATYTFYADAETLTWGWQLEVLYC
ncbi:MAG: hypothetical protein IJI38_07170, partial [Clostridia bacterium]|nr:hypothetical protein [Clostridia bacterium]